VIPAVAKAAARLVVAGVFATLSAEAALPPAPTRWVTDEAAFLSEPVRQALDAKLEEYQQRTGHHVLVWIGRSTGLVPIEDFAVSAFQAWRVGRQGIDDGLVLFLFADDRKVRVEVGYGLEARVPDAIASRIIQETIVPKIRAGDKDGAVQSGVDALLAAIDGGAAAGDRAERPPPAAGESGPSTAQKVLWAVVLLALLLFVVTHPSLALYMLVNLLSSSGGGYRGSGGGGWSSGGGGYSGGGGRSGGGGATGSW
jgi:uncharacterized protein